MTINSFSGEYRFLSNFYPAEVIYGGKKYPSVEHAYQAAKTTDELSRKEIREAETAKLAKNLGKYVAMRHDWGGIRINVMRKLIQRKFSSPDLLAKLLATGNATLIEGNTWKDHYFGVCNGVGQNHLGKILMEVREASK